jgi:hypothetical protein
MDEVDIASVTRDHENVIGDWRELIDRGTGLVWGVVAKTTHCLGTHEPRSHVRMSNTTGIPDRYRYRNGSTVQYVQTD